MKNTLELEAEIPGWYIKPTLVLGCGNVLMGDDGFGPAVIEELEKNYCVPEEVCILNVGTSAREIIFPMVVDESRVEKVIIVDAVDMADRGYKPGDVFEISIDDIPMVKVDDFSMHQVPSSNLLKELRERRKVKVIVLACQIKSIPELVTQGLSDPVRGAVSRMCELVSEHWM
ncbi:MAG: hypothetical protein AYK23_01285 [Candidatus Proteinoplasmatales archaeon SG8-5]|nr:MAG: hypothetical protein AYK23_01285 [Candidatus Proteinoplasmatales archaeon SG8-5]